MSTICKGGAPLWHIASAHLHFALKQMGDIVGRHLTPLYAVNPLPQTASSFYTLREVAIIFGTNEDTARRWCRQGRIPCVKPGGAYRVPKDALHALMGIGQTSNEPF